MSGLAGALPVLVALRLDLEASGGADGSAQARPAELQADQQAQLQAELRENLPAWQARVAAAQSAALACGGVPESALLRRYENLPLLSLPAAAAAQLAGCPQVRAVGPDIALQPQTAQSVPLVAADQWQALGWTGQGGAVAVLDSGVRWSEPQLGGCLGAGCRVVGEDVADGDDDPDDCTGHGTNVAAIIAGTRGMAPGATIVAIKVFPDRDCYNADISTIAAGLDRVVALRARYNILAVNMSLGGSQLYDRACDGAVAPESAYNAALETVAAAGIAVIVSAGNNGDPGRVSYPACWSGSFAVTAVYDSDVGDIAWLNCADDRTAADRIVCFSNGGPMVDMAAPGALIAAGGEEMGGTSQAAPHVSGALLLMAEAARGAGGAEADPQDLLSRLQRAGAPITDRRGAQEQVYPRLDLAPLLPAGGPDDDHRDSRADSVDGADAGKAPAACGCSATGPEQPWLAPALAGMAMGLAGWTVRRARRSDSGL